MLLLRTVVSVLGFLVAATVFASSAAQPSVKNASPGKHTSQGFSYTVGKLPTWVDSPVSPPSRAQAESGWHYVLHDEQIYAPQNELQTHINIVRRVNTAAGLTDAARIELAFEPSYQTLVMHELAIRRSGQVINKLIPKNITLLRREQGLDQLRYDGFVTASMNVDDVRVGDLISYRYTISGDNPALQGRLSMLLGIKLQVPADVTRYRFLRAANRDLKIEGGDTFDRRENNVAALKETVLTARDTSAWQFRENSPPGDSLRNLLSITEFNDWRDVASWGRQLFALEPSSQPKLAALAKQIMADAGDKPSARAEAALAFVQKDIRYFSILFGASSHRPTAPDRVLEQRFGDCKDKSLLLIALLKEMGIDAYPVLVSFFYRGDVARHPASHTAFDHVVAGVDIDGKTYWLDGTRTTQSGSLEAKQAWAFGFGLPLRPATATLAAAPLRPSHEIDSIAKDTFTVGVIGEPALLNSTVTYMGEWAERVQSILDSSQREQASAELFSFVGRRFAEATESQKFTATPSANKTELVVSREWRVPDTFELVDGKSLLSAALPWSIMPILASGMDNQRATSIYLGQKVRKRHIVEYKFDDEIAKDARENIYTVEGKHFKFILSFKQQPKNALFVYDFETLTEVVTAEEIKVFQEKVREVTTKALGQIGFGTIPYAQVESLQKELRELGKKIERRELKYVTTTQEGAAVGIVLDNAKLANNRLTRKQRAIILQARAISHDYLMRTDKALADITESISLDPARAESYGTLAEIRSGRGEFKEALVALADEKKRSSEQDGTLYQQGRAKYYLGDFASAAQDFEARIKQAGSRDKAYAWLWLNMTYNQLGQENREKIRGYSDEIKLSEWPMPLVKYYRGDIDEGALIKAAQDANNSKQRWQLCEAHYFIGQRYLHAKDVRAARKAFERARETEVFEFIEYRAAGVELERLGK
jgi:lipoprotein NlpI